MEDRSAFETALESFRAASENAVLAHFERNGFTFAVPFVQTAERRGAKYVKLWRGETHTGEEPRINSIHAFVEISTGDIFKPASTKAPAKHKRGNIFEDAGRASLSDAGCVVYMR
jgi:hypothetical protein